MSGNGEITVYFASTAWRQMLALVKVAKTEVSGFGRTHVDEDGDIICEQVVMLNQWGSGSSTHIDMEAIGQFVTELVKSKGPEEIKSWLLWFHSHPDFGTTFSGQDYVSLRDRAVTGGVPYFVGICLNTKGESTAYVHMTKPFSLVVEGNVTVLRSKEETRFRNWEKKADDVAEEWAKEEVEAHMKEDPAVEERKAKAKEDGDKGGSHAVVHKVLTETCRCGRYLTEIVRHGAWSLKHCIGCDRIESYCDCEALDFSNMGKRKQKRARRSRTVKPQQAVLPGTGPTGYNAALTHPSRGPLESAIVPERYCDCGHRIYKVASHGIDGEYKCIGCLQKEGECECQPVGAQLGSGYGGIW